VQLDHEVDITIGLCVATRDRPEHAHVAGIVRGGDAKDIVAVGTQLVERRGRPHAH
jgi:hypothetical protein